jgi:hypothetical protein
MAQSGKEINHIWCEWQWDYVQITWQYLEETSRQNKIKRNEDSQPEILKFFICGPVSILL